MKKFVGSFDAFDIEIVRSVRLYMWYIVEHLLFALYILILSIEAHYLFCLGFVLVGWSLHQSIKCLVPAVKRLKYFNGHWWVDYGEGMTDQVAVKLKWCTPLVVIFCVQVEKMKPIQFCLAQDSTREPNDFRHVYRVCRYLR